VALVIISYKIQSQTGSALAALTRPDQDRRARNIWMNPMRLTPNTTPLAKSSRKSTVRTWGAARWAATRPTIIGTTKTAA
jgi:hypothetical protein